MLTRFMAEAMMDLYSGRTTAARHLNEDVQAHEDQLALQANEDRRHTPFYLRLLPAALRAAVQRRRTETAMIELWKISPHLLDDVGVVLGRMQDLPGHLIPAPKRLLQEVAAADPAQIVAAELAFPPPPPAPQMSAEPARSDRFARPSLAQAI